MKNKMKATWFNLKTAAMRFGPMATAIAVTGTQVIMNTGFAQNAGGSAQDLAKEILGIVASLIIALGLFIAALGVVNFASAHAEGNGGAQDKAVKQIAAGVMVIAASAILKSKADVLAKYITTT